MSTIKLTDANGVNLTRKQYAAIAAKSKAQRERVAKHCEAVADARGDDKGRKWANFAKGLRSEAHGTYVAAWTAEGDDRKAKFAEYHAFMRKGTAKPKATKAAKASAQVADTTQALTDALVEGRITAEEFAHAVQALNA